MKKTNEIKYSKLLGFGSVGDLISGSVDFQDEALAGKLGAKVGAAAFPAGRGVEGVIPSLFCSERGLNEKDQ